MKTKSLKSFFRLYKLSKLIGMIHMNSKVILLALLLALIGIQADTFSNVLADINDTPGGGVENVRYSVQNQKVIVSYDLVGTPGKQYTVQLILRKESDASYQYIPSAISGDVGVHQSPGKDKQIEWDISEEFPGGLFGKDFYFVVSAKEIDESPSFLSWIGIGVAAVAATATYLIISKKVTNNNSSPGSSSFPLPPGRP